MLVVSKEVLVVELLDVLKEKEDVSIHPVKNNPVIMMNGNNFFFIQFI
jgi:hypothetical protein